MDINNVVLIGRLVRDPELSYTANGHAVCKFALAVNEYKKDEVSFIACVAWNKTAETISKYVGQGRRIGVEGSLKQERWEKDGKKQSKTKVYVNRIQFLDKKDNSSSSSEDYKDKHYNNIPY